MSNRRNLIKSRVNLSTEDNFFDVINASQSLEEQRLKAKNFLQTKRLPPDIDGRSVFANTELDLSRIDVYGFDYDYTLARYALPFKRNSALYVHTSTYIARHVRRG